MAYFEGTIKEFTKFIGPYARIKVAFLAAKHKKQIGKCEDCGSMALLDAAHIKGRERPLIIANILSEFIDDGIILVDLAEFEDKFVEAHLPIESTIRILCRTCHQQYDKREKISNAVEKNPKVKDESEVIEKLVANQMNKSKAIKLANERGLTMTTNTNTVFSNIINTLDSWWLQPHNEKFQADLYIILNHDQIKSLFLFKLPANTITDPAQLFKQRNDKYRSNCSDIYIARSGISFKEKNGFDFTNYLIEKIDYTV